MIMTDVQPVDRVEFKRHHQMDMPKRTCQVTGADMADEPENPDAAADRLEAALERIAQLAAVQPAPSRILAQDSELSIPEIAERLDSLIGRLRAALGKTD
jgi:hypothetical protein